MPSAAYALPPCCHNNAVVEPPPYPTLGSVATSSPSDGAWSCVVSQSERRCRAIPSGAHFRFLREWRRKGRGGRTTSWLWRGTGGGGAGPSSLWHRTRTTSSAPPRATSSAPWAPTWSDPSTKSGGQGSRADELKNQSKRLLGVVAFASTITTFTGSFRSMRAWIPKNQSMQLKTNNSTQIQHVSGLPKDWQEKKSRADQLCSRAPFYNHMTKRYELDFREMARRMGYKAQTSVKNFQMTLEENRRQTLLQLGRVGKSRYTMDFRYPLTGYQAFCICLALIDAKLCCTL